MKNCLIAALLLISAAVVLSQDAAQNATLEGTWQVFQASTLSRYSLKEYQNPASSIASGTMTLNSDGTISIDVPGMTVQSWSTDEGFLLFVTPTGNQFYWPRVLNQNLYYLVQVDVTELNEEVIYLKSKPDGNLVIIRQ